jgi:metal-sulfur cluster biosynthetic enzyme
MFAPELNSMVTKNDVLKVLKKIVDPEIGINIVDLGFIYDVKTSKKSIDVKMTLTSPGCPIHQMFIKEVEDVLKNKFKTNVNVELVFDPPWTPDRISKDVRKKLGIKY